METYGFAADELDFLRSLDRPEKIQDYLDSLHYNFCNGGYVCKSPRMVMKEGNAHCLEGAILASAARMVNGNTPLMIELKAEEDKPDDYHFITPFEHKGSWGAIAQSKTYTLRWRDPIHASIRELALSYFQGYIEKDELTLKSYTMPVDISRLGENDWTTAENGVGYIGIKFDDFQHFDLYPSGLVIRKVPPELEEIFKKHKNVHNLK